MDHSVPSLACDAPAAAAVAARIGAVSFLNTAPLIDGLDRLGDVSIRFTVPSRLIDSLLERETDVALCSSIDYQRSPIPLRIVPAGLLGCDGATLTVRLYASKPIHTLQRVHCDTDSHTSIALLRILLREIYDIDPTLIDYDAREHVAENRPIEWPDAMLLIGDKVVTDSPPAVRYPHQLDLGAAWTNITSLPFVFACWMCRADCDPAIIRLAAITLDRQRRYNRMQLDDLMRRHAMRSNWPLDLAREYLTANLCYEWTESRRAGLEAFFSRASAHGLIEQVRPIEFTEL